MISSLRPSRGGCIDKFVSRGERGRSVTSVESNQNLQHVYRVMQPQPRAKQGVVGSDIDSLNRRTMSLVVLIKTRQDGSSMVAASSASRRRMYARWPLRSLSPRRPLCFSRWRRTLRRSFVITRLFCRKFESRKLRSRLFFRLIHRDNEFLIIRVFVFVRMLDPRNLNKKKERFYANSFA